LTRYGSLIDQMTCFGWHACITVDATPGEIFELIDPRITAESVSHQA
jgi:hypothetical protein